MSEPFRDTDQLIERVLAWRADRARPVGLLDRIQERLDMEPRARTQAWSIFRWAPARLVWLLIAAALLAAVAGGAAISGARLDFWSVAPAPVPSLKPSQAPQSALSMVFCDKVRSLPFAGASTSLTGAWSDRSSLYYLRQDGNVVWGEASFGVGRLESLTPLTGHRSTVFHGTVGSGGNVQLDWADVGAVNPGDSSFVPPLGGGTVVLRLQAGAGGNAEMVSVSQSGSVRMGPGSSTSLVFSPCVPSDQP